MTKEDMTDIVIAWMFSQCPALLEQGDFHEGFALFCWQVWEAAVQQERRRRMEILYNPEDILIN